MFFKKGEREERVSEVRDCERSAVLMDVRFVLSTSHLASTLLNGVLGVLGVPSLLIF